jgi:hypothetical protein
MKNADPLLISRLADALGYQPTGEQISCVEAALTRKNTVITAGAGTGKTSTLVMIGLALEAVRCQFIAYNKSVQKDAATRFSKNVKCNTAHSLAFRAFPEHGKRAMSSPRMSGRQVAYVLDIEHGYALPNDRELSPARLAGLVLETVGRFCNSADKGISLKHFPEVEGAEEVSHELGEFIVRIARKAWETDLQNSRGSLPFTHDMYLKVWALSNPRIAAEVILYDEAQDADPCILGVVLAQERFGTQLIAVGDESQAIYAWRGAINAMRNFPAEARATLAKSFRFGQAVADEANVFLARLGAPLRIEGAGPESTVGTIDPIEADAILCRTNAKVIETALAIHNARRFAIVGGTYGIRKFAEAADALMNGRKAAWHADLGAFKNWDDVIDYVNNDHGGSDLRALVNMVTDFGTDTLIEIADKAVDEEKGNPDVVITTAHKAKGREWDNVLIANDFEPPVDPETGERREPSQADLMLAYVSVTRAKKRLDATALAWAK